MRKNEIVVARYEENIDWLSSIDGFEIKVYNKKSGENLLENVGREAHTYLSHIVKNYENLADFTVFLQGDPFYHCRDLKQKLIKSRLEEYDFVCFSDSIITCDLNGRPGCGGSGIIHMPVGKHYEWVTGKTSPEVFVSPAAAQFGASKSVILANPLSLYQRALASVSYSNNPIEAHCLERSWLSIFGFRSTMTHKNISYGLDSELDVQLYFKQFYDPSFDRIKYAGQLGPYAGEKS
jgi:hypothetical protein